MQDRLISIHVKIEIPSDDPDIRTEELTFYENDYSVFLKIHLVKRHKEPQNKGIRDEPTRMVACHNAQGRKVDGWARICKKGETTKTCTHVKLR